MNEKLRKARKDRYWSIEVAAEKIGISRTTYLRWEHGEQIPHASTLLLACEAFNMSAAQLGFETFAYETNNGLMQEKGRWQPKATINPTGIETGQTPAQIEVSPLQGFLLDEEQGVVPQKRERMYDALEIIVAGLRPGFQPGEISPFQRSIQAKIKECDLMMQHNSGEEVRISRRQALQTIAKLPIQMYGLATLGDVGMRSIHAEEILPLCAAGLVASRALLQEENTASIANILATYLPVLEALARQSSPSQQAAAHLVAQSYLLATILADHRGKLDYMEAYSREARKFGQLAGDPNLEVSALARLAVKFDYEGRDRKALETYQEALAIPSLHLVSPLLCGRLYAGLAGTYAYCHYREEALNYLGLAKDVYPVQPEGDASFHFAYSGENTLSLWEGLTRKHLGQYIQSRDTFLYHAKMQPQQGLRETNRAEFLNYVASVAVKQRQLDVAYHYLDAAEEIAWTIKHEQRYAEVLDTFRSLQLLWPDEPAVSNLRDKLNDRRSYAE